jgi:hypothetical protein
MAPFNGDTFIEAEFERLIQKHKIVTAIETGTYCGDTAAWLAGRVPQVITIEIDSQWDSKQLREHPNVTTLYGDSCELLEGVIRNAEGPFLFFLDCHWGIPTPTPKELQAIARSGVKPIIAIHDFHVPGHRELGFDAYADFVYDLEHVVPHFDAIYGKGGWSHHYNSEAEGSMRGIIYVEPLN